MNRFNCNLNKRKLSTLESRKKKLFRITPQWEKTEI